MFKDRWRVLVCSRSLWEYFSLICSPWAWDCTWRSSASFLFAFICSYTGHTASFSHHASTCPMTQTETGSTPSCCFFFFLPLARRWVFLSCPSACPRLFRPSAELWPSGRWHLRRSHQTSGTEFHPEPRSVKQEHEADQGWITHTYTSPRKTYAFTHHFNAPFLLPADFPTEKQILKINHNCTLDHILSMIATRVAKFQESLHGNLQEFVGLTRELTGIFLNWRLGTWI